MKHIDLLLERYPQLTGCGDSIRAACDMIIQSYRNGSKLLLCGNGGSCADADHISGELLKGFTKKRPLQNDLSDKLMETDPELGASLARSLQSPLRAVNLCALGALSSAFVNDVNPHFVYAQLALAYCDPGDVLLGISTSGNAFNVLAAAVTATAMGANTVGLTGRDGGKMNGMFGCLIKVPESETYRVQELHLPVYHAICMEVEDAFFKC